MVFPLRARRLRSALTIVAMAAAALLVLPATSADAANRGLPEDLCQQDPPNADYHDRADIDDAHLDAVDCLSELGVVEGEQTDDGTRYFPDQDISRAQMATFVVAGLEAANVSLPPAEDQGFQDVEDGDTHASSIRRIAAAGIVQGVEDDRYHPDALVSRQQMATFLVQAVEYAADQELRAAKTDTNGIEFGDLKGGEMPFEDIPENSTHRESVAGAFELGIATGVSESRYEPFDQVHRDAMASFVARGLDAITQRTPVANRDTGAFARTVFTFGAESGRCFQVKAGDAWTAECDPARSDQTLQLRPVPVGDDFTVIAGLVTGNVTRVEVEFGDGESVEAGLVPTDSGDLQAWSSRILQADIDAVVAYDDGEEVAREQP